MEIYGFLFEGFARNKNVHGFGLEITLSPVVFVEDSFRITTNYNHPNPPRKLPSLFRNGLEVVLLKLRIVKRKQMTL